jgi:zinc/manganese transport system substrate-binding protein
MLGMVIIGVVVVRHVSLLSGRQGCGFRGFHFQGRRTPISKPWLAPLLLGVALLLPPAPAQAATVVAADGVLCDLTRTLAQGLIKVVCLLPASQDPHQAALRPSDRQVLAQSDLVLVNGFGLTPALSKVQGRRPQVAVAELAVPNSPSFEGAGGVRDPHVWHDPRQAAAMVRLIAERLAPFTDQDSRLRSRSQQAALVLTDLDAWTARQIATLPPSARVLASGHRAFRSFARRYGIRELAVIESFSTAGLLRPQGLNQVSDALQRSGARVIFPDRLPPSKTLRRISQRSGVPISSVALVADGLAAKASYVETFTANVCTFVEGQGGSCDRAGGQQLARRWAAIR